MAASRFHPDRHEQTEAKVCYGVKPDFAPRPRDFCFTSNIRHRSRNRIAVYGDDRLAVRRAKVNRAVALCTRRRVRFSPVTD